MKIFQTMFKQEIKFWDVPLYCIDAMGKAPTFNSHLLVCTTHSLIQIHLNLFQKMCYTFRKYQLISSPSKTSIKSLTKSPRDLIWIKTTITPSQAVGCGLGVATFIFTLVAFIDSGGNKGWVLGLQLVLLQSFARIYVFLRFSFI